MMLQPVICSRTAADWRDSGWLEFMAVHVQDSAEPGFFVRPGVLCGASASILNQLLQNVSILEVSSFCLMQSRLCNFCNSNQNNTKINGSNSKQYKGTQHVSVGASCSHSEAAVSGWGPERQHQMCQLCFSCFDVSDVSCVFILVVWIREPPQMWHIKGETLNKRVCSRFLQIGGFDGYKNDVSL